MKVESIAECSLRALCNAFDLHKAIIGLENLFCLFNRLYKERFQPSHGVK